MKTTQRRPRVLECIHRHGSQRFSQVFPPGQCCSRNIVRAIPGVWVWLACKAKSRAQRLPGGQQALYALARLRNRVSCRRPPSDALSAPVLAGAWRVPQDASSSLCKFRPSGGLPCDLRKCQEGHENRAEVGVVCGSSAVPRNGVGTSGRPDLGDAEDPQSGDRGSEPEDEGCTRQTAITERSRGRKDLPATGPQTWAAGCHFLSDSFRQCSGGALVVGWGSFGFCLFCLWRCSRRVLEPLLP
uniref:Uncharacterized protein n=1 Tax=Toxoplasma gondii (strain ATCC 50861 / VEG) TaxID=432359 RepID=A0A0F7V9F4_TOXGV|nr:TPA: hypothetical protein BN1205_037520 [Toxoplasma gondii VEG]